MCVDHQLILVPTQIAHCFAGIVAHGPVASDASPHYLEVVVDEFISVLSTCAEV